MADELKPDETTQTQTEEKTFTQTQLDAIIKDRVARESKKFEDYDTVKSEMDKLIHEKKEREEAELSETERLKKELEEKNGLLTDYESKVKTFEDKETERRTALETKVEAAMEELDDTQKALVEKMPLDERLNLIEQLQTAKVEPGQWPKGTKTATPDMTHVQEMHDKYGPGSKQFRTAMEDYRNLKANR